jgi:predicted house-cleaning noncanonical NTP pyrophosphatase (MazG superfamily)
MKKVREFRKLVRGRVPEIIRESGSVPVIRTVEGKEWRNALIQKLREEAKSREQFLEEAADVYEVLLTAVNEAGFVDADLQSAAKKKRADRGSFSGHVWLEHVEDLD